MTCITPGSYYIPKTYFYQKIIDLGENVKWQPEKASDINCMGTKELIKQGKPIKKPIVDSFRTFVNFPSNLKIFQQRTDQLRKSVHKFLS